MDDLGGEACSATVCGACEKNKVTYANSSIFAGVCRIRIRSDPELLAGSRSTIFISDPEEKKQFQN